MGYKRDHVSIKPAIVVKNNVVVAVDKPIEEVVVKNSPKMMEGQIRKVVVTPSNGYMLIANGHPVHAVKVVTQPKIVVDAKEVTVTSVKIAAKVQEAEEPKPAVPAKEQ